MQIISIVTSVTVFVFSEAQNVPSGLNTWLPKRIIFQYQFSIKKTPI